MTPLEEEITELTSKWYNYVGLDHHKSRDVRWYIEQNYEYGEKPYFQAWHWSYIGSDFEGTKCTTLEEAQEELRDNLLLQIHNQKQMVIRNLKEAEEDADSFYDPDEYKRMLEALNG